MITREQVKDLQPGDVVEITSDRWPDVVMRGPLHESRGWLSLGPWGVREADGSPYLDLGGKSTRTLTVVSRAQRPLYVNHSRTEPVPGDVVRDEDADGTRIILRTAGDQIPDGWIDQDGVERDFGLYPGRRLRLLVDGETGQQVSS